VKNGSFVRVKSGLYKDDIAVVEAVQPSEQLLLLKILPRCEGKGLANTA
jgi:transcription antitermination factor NusG